VPAARLREDDWLRSCDGQNDGLAVLGERRLRLRKVHDRDFSREYRDKKSYGKDAIRDHALFVATNIRRPANVCYVESAHGSSSCVTIWSAAGRQNAARQARSRRQYLLQDKPVGMMIYSGF